MAQAADGTIYINTELDQSGLKDGIRNIKTALANMGKNVEKMGTSAKEAVSDIGNLAKESVNAAKSAKTVQKSVDEIVQKALSGAKLTAKEMEVFESAMDGAREKTAENLSTVKGQIKAYAEMTEWQKRMHQLDKEESATDKYFSGGTLSASEMDDFAAAVARAREEVGETLSSLYEEKSAVEDINEAYSTGKGEAAPTYDQAALQYVEDYARYIEEVKESERSLEGFNVWRQEAAAAQEAASASAASGQSLGNMGYQAEVTSQRIIDLQIRLEELKKRQTELEGMGVGLGTAEYDANVTEMARLNEEINQYKANLEDLEPKKSIWQKLGDAVKNLTQKTSEAGSATKKNFKDGLKSVLRYGFGIRSVFVLMNKLRNAVVEGFKNMAQADSSTNASLSTLMSSLTQLKNSLATAFQPILTVVTPILSTLMNALSKAATYVGMFIATLTGQKTFTKAVAVNQDYAASLSSTASAANDAADATKSAAKANKQYLSGLDEIKTFTSDDDTSSSTGSGGTGGTGSGVSASDMFETVEIPNAVGNWADLFKEAWENADFTEIGTIVGTKLTNALNSIPWDGIKESCNKVAKSIATFLNGFIETPGLWQAIGTTAAEGLNTAIGALDTFVDNFHWDSLSKGIFEGLGAAISNIDYASISSTISHVLSGIIDLVSGAIQALDWAGMIKTVFSALKQLLTGFDYASLFSSVGELVGSALASVLKLAIDVPKLLADTIGNIGQSIYDYFAGYIDDQDYGDIGTNIIMGVFNGIVDFIKGIGTWLKDNVFQPFIDGFCSAFNLGSPSKDPSIIELGTNIILGVFNGIIEFIKGIGTWIKENVFEPVVKAFTDGDGGSFFTDAASAIWDGITGAFGKVSAVITATVTAVKDKAFDTVTSAWNAIEDKTSQLTAAAKEKVSGALSTLKDKWDSVKDKAADLLTTAKEKTTGALASLKQKWDSIDDKGSILTATAKNAAASVLSTLQSGWEAVKTKAATLTGTAKNSAASVLTTLKDSWSTIYTKVATVTGKAVNSNSKALSTLKDAWKTLKTKTVTLTANIKGKLSDIWNKIMGKATGGIMVNGRWQNIEGYASGGSPKSARLFYANENGIPELVGSIGSNTAVMNNGQIVASVAAGVYKAVAAAMGSLATYFSSMTLSIASIPSSIEYLANSIPDFSNVSAPIISTGTIVPTSVSIDKDSINELKSIVEDLKTALNAASLTSASTGSTATATSIRVIGQINRRTLFDEFIDEAKARQLATGTNPLNI